MNFGKKQLGFTLIEVMLAMTLLSIMVMLLFGTLRISAQSWDAGESKMSQVNETALVYNFFQRHLATARPLSDDMLKNGQDFSSVNSAAASSFQGTSSSLRFVSAFPASAARPGLQLFMIEQVPQQDKGNAIKVTITPFFPMIDGEEWEPEEEFLLADVRNFQLAYFGLDESTGDSFWQDNWQDRNKLPALVKITITRSDEIFWPDMVIAVKTADVAVVQAQNQEAVVE
ncbi:MAG: prepilin-type N-terminal cleavage/methylation domain-containing protein [Gammaproteobacteria bacterium]